MSLDAMTCVWRHSKAKGGALTVFLAIADEANDLGESCYPGVERIARKSRLSVRNVQILIRKLEAMGELQVSIGTGPHGCNEYSMRKFMEYHGVIEARRQAKSKGEKIAPPQRLHPEKTSLGGVKNPGREFHPTREDPLLTREREEAALPPPHPPVEVTTPIQAPPRPASPALAQFSPDFREAWQRWTRHLDEKDIRLTSMSEGSQLLTCQRYGEARAITIINFSIEKGAKNLLWEQPEREIPKHLRYHGPATDNTKPMTAPAVPGLREWIARKYPQANADTPWAELGVDVRKQFAEEHPGLEFRGHLLAIYVGRRG